MTTTHQVDAEIQIVSDIEIEAQARLDDILAGREPAPPSEALVARANDRLDAALPPAKRANASKVLSIVREATKPVDLGTITYGIYGEDTKPLRGNASYHVRKLVAKGELTTVGPKSKPKYTMGTGKAVKTKRVAAKSTPSAPALSVGDLFEYVGLASDGSLIVRQMESLRLYKIAAV